MANDEPAIVKPINVAMNKSPFLFAGEDDIKRTETAICLLTMHKKLAQGGTFAVGKYTAASQDRDLQDSSVSVAINPADHSISRWLRCDRNSRRVIGFDHQLLQWGSFQTADASDKHNVKAFDLGALPDNVQDFEAHLVAKIKAFRIQRGIAYDSVVGFAYILYVQNHSHSGNQNVPNSMAFFGAPLSAFALDFNGNRFVDDLQHSQEQNEDLTIGDLNEIEAIIYMIDDRLVWMSWNKRSLSWLVTSKIEKIILMHLEREFSSEALAVIKSIQVCPLRPEYQMTNPSLCRELGGSLPTNTAFLHNSTRWKQLFMQLPGPIEQATFAEFKLIIDDILDDDWKDEPRQQIFREWAEHIHPLLTINRFEVWRSIFANVLFKHFKEFTTMTFDTATYSELHDNPDIQRALDSRYAEQTTLHHRELQVMLECFDSELFRREFQINGTFGNFILGVCSRNLDVKITEIFDHQFIVCPNAQDSRLMQVTQLDFSPAAGFPLSNDCPDWNCPESQVCVTMHFVYV